MTYQVRSKVAIMLAFVPCLRVGNRGILCSFCAFELYSTVFMESAELLADDNEDVVVDVC